MHGSVINRLLMERVDSYMYSSIFCASLVLLVLFNSSELLALVNIKLV